PPSGALRPDGPVLLLSAEESSPFRPHQHAGEGSNITSSFQPSTGLDRSIVKKRGRCKVCGAVPRPLLWSGRRKDTTACRTVSQEALCVPAGTNTSRTTTDAPPLAGPGRGRWRWFVYHM